MTSYTQPYASNHPTAYPAGSAFTPPPASANSHGDGHTFYTYGSGPEQPLYASPGVSREQYRSMHSQPDESSPKRPQLDKKARAKAGIAFFGFWILASGMAFLMYADRYM
ncbi:MAG: hypothetical protein RhofKO_32240 [Rhodothermales bacterium]